MHCRAYLLLEREYSKILKNPEWGIHVTPSESNIFCWYATICGLNDSIWENGRFHLTIRFTENYDDEYPEIKFNTIPFHPNIDPLTGEPRVDVFQQGSENSIGKVSVIELLVNLQALLSNPVLENAVNTEAAGLLRTAPHIYTQLVKNCVTESRKLIELLKGQDLEKTSRKQGKLEFFSPKKPTSSTDSCGRKAKQVSFDEYHKSWVRIASSQPLDTMPSGIHSKMGMDDLVYYGEGHAHDTVENSAKAVESPTPSTVSKTLTTDTEQKLNRMRERKLQRINAMKQLYLNSANKESPGSAAPVSSRIDMSDFNKRHETWEKEADELVAWTTTLEADVV